MKCFYKHSSSVKALIRNKTDRERNKLCLNHFVIKNVAVISAERQALIEKVNNFKIN